ncbi:hypothetical protein PR003_g17725 [Phytophthora rubi]|uniref:RxLR effector protein n=1 Tax=Phytophthora rubi TaxID=129364 RepID=A0A6A4ED04_9STRA|nr:hypothetical protein PR002_g17065 [Phytophthora rubi]KAE9007329.1 hypothetical protein PR001_g16998 [Phytophthora rubi]KAE9320400.1 hypothetical protein PR003_g17725 [Phytophthora rubi]
MIASVVLSWIAGLVHCRLSAGWGRGPSRSTAAHKSRLCCQCQTFVDRQHASKALQ